MIAPSVEVLIEHPTMLAEEIRRHAVTLCGKTAAAAREIPEAEADELSAGIMLGCAGKFIPSPYDRPAIIFDYVDENTLLFVPEPVKNKEKVRTSL